MSSDSSRTQQRGLFFLLWVPVWMCVCMSDALTENITLFMNRQDCIPLFLPHIDKLPFLRERERERETFLCWRAWMGRCCQGRWTFNVRTCFCVCVCVCVELQSRRLTYGVEWCCFTLFYRRSRGQSASLEDTLLFKSLGSLKGFLMCLKKK